MSIFVSVGWRYAVVAYVNKHDQLCEIAVCEIEKLSVIADGFEIVTLQNDTNILSVCYCSPDGNFSNFLSPLDRLFVFVYANEYMLWIGGDFNTDNLINSKNQGDLEARLECNGFCNVESPNHTTSTASYLIDLFVTNVRTNLISTGALLSDVSDHFQCCYF